MRTRHRSRCARRRCVHGAEAPRSETPRARITHDAEVCRLVADGSLERIVVAMLSPDGVTPAAVAAYFLATVPDMQRRRDPPGCVRRRVHARRTGATCLVLLGSGWRRSSNNRRRVVRADRQSSVDTTNGGGGDDGSGGISIDTTRSLLGI